MIKKILIISFFFINNKAVFSQEKNKIISGQVSDSLGTVKNANIINLKTNQGTFSNNDGVFRIFVSEGDSIKVSSVQHISKTIFINKKLLKTKTYSFY